ncbi:hypothetical protein HHL28_16365 [Aerophototrophica crusticola]|uniref:Lipoprotein n=1 Tax=Aerophototrophica crusticola TaxID=1709002 RepID=A0A858RBV8_9PROT|nr:hypothetical protein HHL28_16365 [Rhodospirillaceae bacterium B3]
MRQGIVAALLLPLLLGACSAGGPQGSGPVAAPARATVAEAPAPALTDEQLFGISQVAAAVTSPELARPLVRITPDNPDLVWRDGAKGRQVKVASVMPAGSYRKYYLGKATGTSPKGWGTMWVTAAPQLQRFCAAVPGDADAKRRRVQQWLGLRPEANDPWVVEFWVEPASLARPCPNPDITAESCPVDTPQTVARPTCDAKDKACAEKVGFVDWLDSYTRLSVVAGGYPWTRLGYTFDWKPAEGKPPVGETVAFSRYGATEFILRPNQPYEQASATTLGDYCK